MAFTTSIGRDRRLRVLVLGIVLCGLAPMFGTAAAGPEREERFRLRESRLTFPSQPPVLVHPVEDGIPDALVPGGVSTEVRGNALLVDVGGSGSPSKRVRARKPTVLEVGPKEARVPVLLWRGDGTWLGEAARVEGGKVGGRDVSWLLPTGPGSGPQPGWMRWDDGAFRPLTNTNRVQIERGWLTLSPGTGGAEHLLTVVRTLRPKEVSDDRWRGQLAVNEFRNRSGLAPVDLDDARCAAAQAHAEYIILNPEDGFGHEEIPDRPGYSAEGHEAARSGVMERSGDPRVAVARLTAMMLHRPPFLYPAEQPLGVGVVHEAAGHAWYGAAGFIVLWASGKTACNTFPILVPAPGQRDVPLQIVEELPSPEGHSGYYDTSRGYPVSVSFLPGSARNVRLRLRHVADDEAVEGDLFTPESPVHSTFADNFDTAFFTASHPLRPGTVYEATYTADHAGEAVRFTWRFETGR